MHETTTGVTCASFFSAQEVSGVVELGRNHKLNLWCISEDYVVSMLKEMLGPPQVGLRESESPSRQPLRDPVAG
jgi:hypothetical protein